MHVLLDGNDMLIYKREPVHIWYICLILFCCFCCLTHLSWRLKRAFRINCFSSFVDLSNFPIFIFSRTTRPFSTKPGTKHPWLNGIQTCSNEWPRPFSKGKGSKMHWKDVLFPEPLDHPRVKEIQSCSNEWPRSFPRGENNEMAKIDEVKISKDHTAFHDVHDAPLPEFSRIDRIYGCFPEGMQNRHLRSLSMEEFLPCDT